MARFLDNNILLRHLVIEDEGKARACRELLLQLERGEEAVFTTDVVIFRAVYVLQSPRQYNLSPDRIRQLLEPLINLCGLRLPRKGLYRRAFDLYCEMGISFGDAYNAAFMEARGITEVYSHDTDFYRIEGIQRIEPEP